MNDPVNAPSHYAVFPDMEAIDIIKRTLTPEEFRGYLKGNALKYRLRAGEKDSVEQDIAKAKKYQEWLRDGMNTQQTLAQQYKERTINSDSALIRRMHGIDNHISERTVVDDILDSECPSG